ncbi:MAG: 50S ribosomal protein L15 [Candidatus Levybacteria bacterium]|nr:50S ribosomal protein L15 [Candidatus Levybacteria bacterium]
MELHTLATVTEKRLRRLGQGHGSGRSKTAGRGTKGQNARGKRALSFEGGALPLKKRLPFLRGKNKNKVFTNIPVILNMTDLNMLPKASTVDVALLIKHGLVDKAEAMRDGVKILGNGKLTVSLKVSLPTSASAAKAIEKAGGSVI